MNHPTSNLSHDGHTIALNQSCKFEPDWLSHMAAYKPQSTGFGPHKPSSLASLGLDDAQKLRGRRPIDATKYVNILLLDFETLAGLLAFRG